MALSTFVGSLTPPTLTGNVSYTGVGFQPKIVFFWTTNLTADGSAANGNISFGAGISSTDRRSTSSIFQNIGSGNFNAAGHDDTKAIYNLTSVGAVLMAADMVSLDADGFTLNWTTVNVTQEKTFYMALGGTDLTDVKTGQFTRPTSTGNQATTGVGFKPDSVIFFDFRDTTTAPPANSTSTSPRPRFGFGKSSSSRAEVSTRMDAGIGSRGYTRTANVFSAIDDAGNTILAEADLVSLDSDGFTLNWTTVDANAQYVFYIALKGGQFGIGTINQPTSITASNLTAGLDNDGNSTSTTASVSPTGNRLLLLSVASRTGITANPNQPTVTGNGLTWVAVNSTVFDNSSSSRRRLTVFRAMGASPSSGTITIDFGGQNQTDVGWTLDQSSSDVDTSGTNGSGAVVQSAVNQDTTGTGSTLTVTLGAFSNANNATYGTFANSATDGNAVGSGFTLLGATGTAANGISMLSEYKTTNDTSVDVTMGATGELGGIAIEIKSAAQAQGTTGVGFQPTGLILTSRDLVSSTTVDAPGEFSMGAASGASNRFSTWVGETDSITANDAGSNIDATKIMKMFAPGGASPTLNASADLTSFDSDGFTLNWSTVDATARQVIYFAVGNNAAAGPGILGYKTLLGVGL